MPRSSWIRWVLGAVAIGLFVVVAIGLSERQLRLHASIIMGDFRDVMYYPALAFVEGHNPYDTGRYLAEYPAGDVFPLYLPPILLAGAPFAVCSLAASSGVYWVMNLLLLIALSWTALRIAGCRTELSGVVFLAAFLLVSTPGRVNFYVGQVTIPVVLGATAAVVWATRRPLASGVGVAVALLKPTIGVPLAVLMLARRQIRPVLIGAVAVSVVSAVVLGAVWIRSGSGDPVAVIGSNQAMLESDPEVDPLTSTYRVDAMPVLVQLLGLPASTLVQFSCAVVLLGVAAAAVWRRHRASRTADVDGLDDIDLVTFVTPLICVYHYVYDALLLVAPLTVIGSRLIRGAGGRARNSALLVGLTVPFVNATWLPSFRSAVTKLSGGTFVPDMALGSVYRTVSGTISGMTLLVVFVVLVWSAATGLSGSPDADR